MKLRLLLAVFLLGLSGPAFAQADRAAAITELLTVGWDARSSARVEADKLYGQIVEDHPGDRASLYAYALVKMQQRQYPEAGKALDQYLAIQRQDPHAWRAKAWISLLTKNAATSLAELDKLSQVLADEKVKLSEESRAEFIGYLGRIPIA
jgi:tetratricopeptide (TPR) repeat protein